MSKGFKAICQITVFALLGTFMYLSKMVMEFLPNIHILALLIITFTVVYRWRAIFPIIVFIMLTGLLNGFGVWWIPYLYIWLPLWAVTLILPKNMPKKIAVPVYVTVGALYGFLYGTLYAPAQALIFGLDFKGMIAWIIAGLPFDFVHGIGNLLTCTLVVPLAIPLKKVSQRFL